MNKQELEKRKIAYFTMEVGFDPKMPTYSGGLGVLAGENGSGVCVKCLFINKPGAMKGFYG